MTSSILDVNPPVPGNNRVGLHRLEPDHTHRHKHQDQARDFLHFRRHGSLEQLAHNRRKPGAGRCAGRPIPSVPGRACHDEPQHHAFT
ncbi:MAG: hypothetical protein MZV70_33040 [Desulfobacterales bacterium]|nr:hypothetical protein [Desulfobacterales bacterium]